MDRLSEWSRTCRNLLTRLAPEEYVNPFEAQWKPLKSAGRSKARRKSLSISGSGFHDGVVLKSRLLALPAEVRCLIWEYLLCGNTIALYRSNGRLTHCVLNDKNSALPPRGVNAHCEMIKKSETRPPKARLEASDAPSNQRRLYCLALLQSYRLIYSEAVHMLYSGNTFLFLQNSTLRDLHDSIPPKRFQSIRSFNIQWHCYQEVVGRLPESIHGGEDFPEPLALLRNNPQLNTVSIFLQGPFYSKELHEKLISDLAKVQESWISPPPKLFVLRLPCESGEQFLSQDELDQMPAKPIPPFQLVDRKYAQIGEQLDAAGGLDYGWRFGVQYLPCDKPVNEAPAQSMRTYFIWTDVPNNTRESVYRRTLQGY